MDSDTRIKCKKYILKKEKRRMKDLEDSKD